MTATISQIRPTSGKGSRLLKLSVAWTSDASGDFTEATQALYGYLVAVDTIPSGVAAPTADYDVTIVDADGLDVLGGAGADRSATAKERAVHPTINPVVLDGAHTVTIANAGNAKSGTVNLYIETR